MLSTKTVYREPSGYIKPWFKSAVPSGWVICDGNNGTPDLRERFLLAASDGLGKGFQVGDTGGDFSHYHDNFPTLNGTSGIMSTSGSNANLSPTGINQAAAGTDFFTIDGVYDIGHAHDLDVPVSVNNAPTYSADGTPPFYVMRWIMKL